jgi:1-acyl-sn-glycerol-3-phosphate acyltransferase
MGLGLSLRVIAEMARVAAPSLLDLATQSLDRETVDARARAFAQRTLEVVEAQLTVERHVELDADRPHVFMFNHQSHLDIPVLYATLPASTIRVVGRAELVRIPVFVELDRAAELVREGVSIAIAPEGLRSRDGRIQPLKADGFQLAIETGAPIVPVAIRGTMDILPKGGRSMRAGVPVRVVVGSPLEVIGRSVDDLLPEVESFLRRYVEGA